MNTPQVNCEWGAAGIEALRGRTDVFVIIDVLSFTTCVDVAVSRGARVHPYAWNDFSSSDYAARIGGVLAGSSRQAGFSLSPQSLFEIPVGTDLVLPSPNGSTLSRLTGDIPTLAGCLRNARVVAHAASALGRRISLIPGGERWQDGSLRVALEDWLGAGAIAANLEGLFSAEAELAESVFQANQERLSILLTQSISGRELISRGRQADIDLAADLNCSTCQPLLYGRFFAPFTP